MIYCGRAKLKPPIPDFALIPWVVRFPRVSLPPVGGLGHADELQRRVDHILHVGELLALHDGGALAGVDGVAFGGLHIFQSILVWIASTPFLPGQGFCGVWVLGGLQKTARFAIFRSES